jgi:hypothetical protein
MIQAEDLIQEGYWRKHYHTLVDDFYSRISHSNDTLGRIKKQAREDQVDAGPLLAPLIAENAQFEIECKARALRVVQIGADALTQLGFTLEQAREAYKSWA